MPAPRWPWLPWIPVVGLIVQFGRTQDVFLRSKDVARTPEGRAELDREQMRLVLAGTVTASVLVGIMLVMIALQLLG
jgi:hypothetical protein